MFLLVFVLEICFFVTGFLGFLVAAAAVDAFVDAPADDVSRPVRRRFLGEGSSQATVAAEASAAAADAAASPGRDRFAFFAFFAFLTFLTFLSFLTLSVLAGTERSMVAHQASSLRAGGWDGL